MLVKSAMRCAEVPAGIEYSVLRPREQPGGDLPLVYVLHGGGGSRDYLERTAPAFERAWGDGRLPPLVAVTPTAADGCMYMNLRDGSARWEDALVGSFLQHVREAYGATRERRLTMACGPSMGGAASLRLGFKHPDVIGAVAALAPGIPPALDLSEIADDDALWRDRLAPARVFGAPLDAHVWRANNPAAIAHDAPARLRDAGLAIYLECGDEDSFGMHESAELLHRVLFDARIPHEYRLIRGADHVGATFPARFADALAFFAKVITPPPPDPAVTALREQIAKTKPARSP